jgi:hypothetical protein
LLRTILFDFGLDPDDDFLPVLFFLVAMSVLEYIRIATATHWMAARCRNVSIQSTSTSGAAKKTIHVDILTS